MKAALQNAKKLAGESDDLLARAALAVQSEIGATKKIEQITAWVEGKKQPACEPLTVNAVRAIVMREIGVSIAEDDPLLLLLIATQDLNLGGLIDAIKQHKTTCAQYKARCEQLDGNSLDNAQPPQADFSTSGLWGAVWGFIFGIAAGAGIMYWIFAHATR